MQLVVRTALGCNRTHHRPEALATDTPSRSPSLRRTAHIRLRAAVNRSGVPKAPASRRAHRGGLKATVEQRSSSNTTTLTYKNETNPVNIDHNVIHKSWRDDIHLLQRHKHSLADELHCWRRKRINLVKSSVPTSLGGNVAIHRPQAPGNLGYRRSWRRRHPYRTGTCRGEASLQDQEVMGSQNLPKYGKHLLPRARFVGVYCGTKLELTLTANNIQHRLLNLSQSFVVKRHTRGYTPRPTPIGVLIGISVAEKLTLRTPF